MRSEANTSHSFAFAFASTHLTPLLLRSPSTKLDWSMWVAAMGTEEQFQAITDATWKFADETTDRVPLSDWTYTSTPTYAGFQARPVMGGIYAKLLMPHNK